MILNFWEKEMTHDAWVFLDVMIVMLGLIVCVALYISTFEDDSNNDS